MKTALTIAAALIGATLSLSAPAHAENNTLTATALPVVEVGFKVTKFKKHHGHRNDGFVTYKKFGHFGHSGFKKHKVIKHKRHHSNSSHFKRKLKKKIILNRFY